MKRKRRSRASGKPAGPKSVPPQTSQDKSACSNSAAKSVLKNEFSPKRRGELSELAFVYKAASLGFHVAKPYGESERYDFILDAGHRLWRVQVKSTTVLLNGLYHVNAQRHTSHGPVSYQPAEVDFLVAHIIPENTWFILPVALIQHRKSVLFPPRRHPGRPHFFAPYREAWHLLREQ